MSIYGLASWGRDPALTLVFMLDLLFTLFSTASYNLLLILDIMIVWWHGMCCWILMRVDILDTWHYPDDSMVVWYALLNIDEGWYSWYLTLSWWYYGVMICSIEHWWWLIVMYGKLCKRSCVMEICVCILDMVCDRMIVGLICDDNCAWHVD